MNFKQYLESKNLSLDALKDTPDVLAGHMNDYNEQTRKAITEAIESKANKEDIDNLRSDLLTQQNKQLDLLNQALKEQGLAIQRISKGSQAPKETSLQAGLSKSADDLKAMKSGDRRDHISFEVNKVPDTMLISTNTSPANSIPNPFREEGVNRIADRMPFVRNWINVSSTTSNVVEWVEQVNRDGGPGGTSEGALKNQADFDLQLVQCNVKKRTMYIKTSKEMLDDISYMRSEINNELLTQLGLDVDDQQLNGDDTGQNLNGLINSATAWAAGVFALQIPDANNYDALVVGINQILLANHMPTTIFLNPSDFHEMCLTKGSDGHYVDFPFTNDAGDIVKGVPIVINNGVPAGDFLIFDGSKATLFERESIMIDVGFENDDFTKNLVTILAEWRGCQRVKGNDTTAFVYGTFATAKTALETP